MPKAVQDERVRFRGHEPSGEGGDARPYKSLLNLHRHGVKPVGSIPQGVEGSRVHEDGSQTRTHGRRPIPAEHA